MGNGVGSGDFITGALYKPMILLFYIGNQMIFAVCCPLNFIISRGIIGGLHPILRDPKDNGVAAMLDDRTFCFVIQHGAIPVFRISRDWLQTTYTLVVIFKAWW